MSEMQDQQRVQLRELLLDKVGRVSVPTITISPQFSMSSEEWRNFLHLILRVMGQVEDKASVPINVDVHDALIGATKHNECEESSDGYHEVLEITNERIVGEVMLCVHCGELFKKCHKTPEELNAHFQEKGLRVDPATYAGGETEKVNAAGTDGDGAQRDETRVPPAEEEGLGC